MGRTLTPSRIKRLISGTKNRIEKRRDAAARADEDLQIKLTESEQEYSNVARETAQRHASELDDCLTRCDEEIDRIFTAAESKTWNSVVAESTGQQDIQQKLKKHLAAAKQKHAQSMGAIQGKHKSARLGPPKLMQQQNRQLDQQFNAVAEHFVWAEDFLHNRSISMPPEVLEEPTSNEIAPWDKNNETNHVDSSRLDVNRSTELSSLEEVSSRLEQLKNEAEAEWKRLKNNPISRLIDGKVIAVIAIVFAIPAAILGYFISDAWLLGIGVGIVAAGVVGIGCALALRPAFRPFAHRIVPKIAATRRTADSIRRRGYSITKLKCAAQLAALDKKFNQLNSDEIARYKVEKSNLKVSHREKLDDLSEIQLKRRFRLSQIREQACSKKTQLGENAENDLKHRQNIESAELLSEHNSAKRTMQEQTVSLLESTSQSANRALESTYDRISRFSDHLGEICLPWSDKVWTYNEPLEHRNIEALLPIGNLEIALDGRATTNLPLIFDWIEHGSLRLLCNNQTEEVAVSIAKNFILRAYTSLPASLLQTMVIDPDGLGRDFSWLMRLADSDPEMVTHRVWTQPVHIHEQLARLAMRTEDIIQQKLRDEFSDLRAYNAAAGAMAEPFQLIVWAGFPSGLDEQTWQHFSALFSSGRRSGVAVLVIDNESIKNSGQICASRIEESGLQIDCRGGVDNLQTIDDDLREFPLSIESVPDDEIQTAILDQCAADALNAGHVEVPFDVLTSGDPSSMLRNSSRDLKIPVGQSGVGRIQELQLGIGTQQHVLVAGKTGSGKSSLLHTLITSAALHYSPEELRMVLLDFKKGVEFQIYAEESLPHADVIGIESEREFGLSAFEYVDRIMQRRGEMFRDSGVQDIGDWRAKHPDGVMPRLLVVVDEFQELFVDDDKLSQQATMLVDRIVRQGRSFGIHVVLASQTLGGAYSLPRTTMAQMAVRVALQCESSDAMLILSEDNAAAERLRHSGQAIYNNAGGRIEGNRPFQVAYLHQSSQRKLISPLRDKSSRRDSSNSFLDQQFVFEGHKPASWNSQLASPYESTNTSSSEEKSQSTFLLGASVAIEPVVQIQLPMSAGRNVLMIGSDDRPLADTLATVLASQIKNWQSQRLAARDIPPEKPVLFLNGARTDDASLTKLAEFVETRDEIELVGTRNFETQFLQLHTELQRRIEQNDESNVDERLLVISGIARFRDLRKYDDFGFGVDSSSDVKPDTAFADLLRDGPTVGIHTVCLADSMNTANRWFSRQTMQDFELRILGQMSNNDSNQLIDSPAASRIGPNILISYDEAAGRIQKFRPFRFEEFSALESWMNS